MNDADFEALKQSVRDMKAHMRGEAVPGARETTPALANPASVRQRMSLSQADFAALLGISVRTLQNWEQGHRAPSGPAARLLQVAAKHPEAVLDAIAP